MPTSPCSRCTWGHTPAWVHLASSCHVRRRFVSRAGGQFTLSAPAVSTRTLAFFFIAGKRKHKSPPYFMAFLPWESRECKQSSGIYFFRSDGFREIRPLFKSKSRGPKGQRASTCWFDEREFSTVIGSCLHASSMTRYTQNRRVKKKLHFRCVNQIHLHVTR